jgi:hypothetical protein
VTQTAGRTLVRGTAMVLGPGGGPATRWTVVSPAAPGKLYALNAVAAVSPALAWAAGQTADRPLIERWDGARWTIVPGPDTPGTVGAALLGVAATEGAAIAVGGAYDRVAGVEIPLVRHWDGLEWTALDLGTGYVLTAVAATSADDVWAVGHGFPHGGAVAGPVAAHWDGTSWTRVPVPGPPRGRLLAVSATAPDDVWAVGGTGPAGRRGVNGPLVLHFDGTAWRTASAPKTDGPLSAVVALGPRDVRAAGGAGVHHWTGRRWHRADPGIASVNTLTALSATDVWAAGGNGELAHHDGERWHRVVSPPPLTGSAVWLGSAAVLPGTVWMVGSMQSPEHQPPAPGANSTEQTGPRGFPMPVLEVSRRDGSASPDSDNPRSPR